MNIIIDGLNLVFRALYAPGMSDLTDNSGRGTGVIHGFIKSVNSLKKKHPNSSFHVCWDGSNQRRKVLFAGYKGNRPSSVGPLEGWDQLVYLKQTLPSLGVNQYVNPEEEADDVIASLVRGPFKVDDNLILSTDRDLLQLVTETTSVLRPAQGTAPETICGPQEVLNEWGVPPAKLVEFRSMDGDVSDCLPRIPKIPNKVLLSLIHTHETLERIYASNFAGISAKQYESIQSAKRQVFLNREIMTLRDVPYTCNPARPDKDKLIQLLSDVDISVEPLLKTFFAS